MIGFCTKLVLKAIITISSRLTMVIVNILSVSFSHLGTEKILPILITYNRIFATKIR